MCPSSSIKATRWSDSESRCLPCQRPCRKPKDTCFRSVSSTFSRHCGTTTQSTRLLIAISNEYKDKGVNAMIISKIGKGMHRNGIKYVESTRELEDNHNVQNLWGKFEHHLHKRARIYVRNI